MKKIILFLFLFFTFLYGRIIVSTYQGEIAYSTNGGRGFNFINSPAPFSFVSDITSDKNGNLYALTETGEIYKSTDNGVTWNWVQNLSLSDAVAVWVDASDRIYVLSRTGDLWTNYSGIWELKVNLGLSDFIEFIPNLNEGSFLAITESGDVVRVNVGATFSYSLISNCGFSNVVSGATSSNSVFIMTEEGDILKSTEGVNYSAIGSLSMFGMSRIIAVSGDSLYAIHETGDIARSLDGIVWSWRGSANQMTVKGLTSDKLASLGAQEYYFALDYNEEGIIIKFYGYERWKIYKNAGDGFNYLLTVKNRSSYIDKDVEGGKKYGYKIKAKGRWFGPLLIYYPERFRERIISFYPFLTHGDLNLILYIRNKGRKEIRVMNAEGRIVYTENVLLDRGRKKIEINVLGFKSGIYFVLFNKDKRKFLVMQK